MSMTTAIELLIVGVGGACGAVLRYAAALVVAKIPGGAFPWATLMVNVAGCFLIGVLIGSQLDQRHQNWRLGFGVGFLGSLTTFSTFSAQTVSATLDGDWSTASLNVAANVVVCLAATFAGIAIGRRWAG